MAGEAHALWVGTRDQSQWASNVPGLQAFEVAGNTKLSQDKPHACIAMVWIFIAPPWEVMLHVFIYI